MKKLTLAVVVGLYAQSAFATNDFWQAAPISTMNHIEAATLPQSLHHLDTSALASTIDKQTQSFDVALPLPDGRFTTFRLTPDTVLAPELAAKYPSIKTFVGYRIDNPSSQGRFDLSVLGFHGVFNHGNDKVFIEPVKMKGAYALAAGDAQIHRSYFRSEMLKQPNPQIRRLAPKIYAALQQQNQHSEAHATDTQSANTQATSNIEQRIVYRLAVATTAEYATYHGGTKERVLSALATMVNRVNDVYERDAAIKFELVADNDKIIYLDGNTDPFDNTDNDIDVNQRVVDDAIGTDNYDIGHVVGTGGGGVAALGSTCSMYKAEGLTGSPTPENDAFFIDYVAHEIGHQMGAEHTFNSNAEGCNGNRSQSSAYEPGSGSTIMAYASLCGEQDLQSNSDPYFHVHSIDQIVAFSRQGTGNTCGTKTSIGNAAPVVNAGQDHRVPANTPFTLTGSATDADNDSLTYSWEQFDLGEATNSKADDERDRGNGPLFRSFSPTNQPTRTLPAMSDVLKGQTSFGEAYATTTRDLNFRLVVRDGKGHVSSDAMKVSVTANTAGFGITQPDASTTWQAGSQTVTWNTAGSQSAPVSCANVAIQLSDDAGATFSRELVASTPNDGEATLSISNVVTDKARLKIRCIDNIFFAVNTANFTINAEGDVKPTFSGQNTLTAAEDTSLTLKVADFNFEGNLQVDSIQASAGENYTLDGLKVTPNANYHGSLSVVVTAKKGDKVSDNFTASITITPVNDAPNAVNDSAQSAYEASNVVIDVLSNDTDIDGDSLTLASVNYNGNGTVSISDNKVSYQPAQGYSGTETFSYSINDGQGGTASADVSVVVADKPSTGGGSSSSGGSSGSLWFALLALLPVGLQRRWMKHR